MLSPPTGVTQGSLHPIVMPLVIHHYDTIIVYVKFPMFINSAKFQSEEHFVTRPIKTTHKVK